MQPFSVRCNSIDYIFLYYFEMRRLYYEMSQMRQ
nr:MAG TPA: hypothetical protein [Caudoviricetes sp.]